MRMLWIVYAGATPDLVTNALARLGAPGWTRFDRAHGAGIHGRVEGTRAWPGDETVIVSVIPAGQALAIADGVAAVVSTLPPAERLHIAVLPVERFQ